MGISRWLVGLIAAGVVSLPLAAPALGDEPEIDFNRDVRPILSANCLICHGPDEEERQGGLRLDRRRDALADLGGGAFAIVPGEPEASELLARVTAENPRHLMPPPDVGDPLTDEQIATLTRWVEAGAPYAEHWAYAPPQAPELPAVEREGWPRNPIDRFILARLEAEHLAPSPEADRPALIRRVSLDLTGLPPTVGEVDKYLADEAPGAYERMVDRILARPGFGEHWARYWLDMARYADSAGYADDVPREIWGYRDYVIAAFNENMPFDQFTIEQLAGDLLDEPSGRQMIATAFHRNTQTNNEGGSDVEEYRNVAVVDRVNTTFELWMGTTMACAQCHTHKYDPITLEEYFQTFAIFNQTADMQRRNEEPLHSFYTAEQQHQRDRWEARIAELERVLTRPTAELEEAYAAWQSRLTGPMNWHTLNPSEVTSEAGATAEVDEEGAVSVARHAARDTYRVSLPLEGVQRLAAVRLETLAHESIAANGPGHAGHGNFVITGIDAELVPEGAAPTPGRYVRIELPGEGRILSLAEVEVYAGGRNVAVAGAARQSSTDYDGPAESAIDGNTDGDYAAGSVTHTEIETDPWWELDLDETHGIDRIVVWNRTDGGPAIAQRLDGFRLKILDEDRQVVHERTMEQAPTAVQARKTIDTSGVRPIRFTAALAEHNQPDFHAESLITGDENGWAIGGALGRSQPLTLVAAAVAVPQGATLKLRIAQQSEHDYHTLGRFRVSVTDAHHVAELAAMPADVREILRRPAEERTAEQADELLRYYIAEAAPELAAERERVAILRQRLKEMEPATVPIMRELPDDERRVTQIQYRGNFLDRGPEVTAAVPEVFHPLPEDVSEPNRLDLAHWLMDPANPLTARVTVNRFWQQIFGIGLVATSEEFGSQGDLPSHPELLDWLAVEFVDSGWDVKHLLRLMVTSAAYRQSSRVDSEMVDRDPQNRLLARGPRFRLGAEAIRDQALAASGLLSAKMYGPPVRPPQPNLGLAAAFGSGIDWQTSEGEDRYRRGIYTNWRRSNPYPSMATFDAPSREVCTVRRNRTNTPLQALVTLNDPVYIEAAQALARRLLEAHDDHADRVRLGFRILLARSPEAFELDTVLDLYHETRQRYLDDADAARAMATDPLGPPPEGVAIADLAAWTVVANILLNLDEALMPR